MTYRVLVTGANKGIGAATVEAIVEARADAVVLLGSRSKERGDAARQRIVDKNASYAERIIVVPIDVGDDASVTNAAAWVAEQLGKAPPPLDGVVNNAGIGLGSDDLAGVLNVNTLGPRRVIEAFLPLLKPNGRIVNVSSASGPMFLAGCSDERKRALTRANVTWKDVEAFMNECIELQRSGGSFADAGLGGGNAYGLSKACLNAYTIALAREHKNLTINACTPGYIATDLTVPDGSAATIDPASRGMKSPAEGTKATMHLLLGEPGGSGWYFGSDAQRSPLDCYRSPGDPPYAGD